MTRDEAFFCEAFRQGFLKAAVSKAKAAKGATSVAGRIGDFLSDTIGRESRTAYRSGKKYLGKEYDDVRKLKRDQRINLAKTDPQASDQRRFLLGAGLLGGGAYAGHRINKSIREKGGTQPSGPNYPVY